MDSVLAIRLGELARSARGRTGMTQQEVARRLPMTAQVYGRLERGKMLPSVETLRSLCRVLAMSADELLDLPPAGEPRASARAAATTMPLRRLLRRAAELLPRQVRIVSPLIAELVRGQPDEPAAPDEQSP